VYVQGVKNPGLDGPFQIEGVPLKLIKKPGESLYLSELLKDNGGRREQAIALLKEGKTREYVCKTLKMSPNKVSEIKKDMDFDSDSEVSA
jgi:hypothetical protein